MFNFVPNRLALIVLISACSIILISMGLRQTFGLFFDAFEKGLGVTRTEFGLAIGIQMLFWDYLLLCLDWINLEVIKLYF